MSYPYAQRVAETTLTYLGGKNRLQFMIGAEKFSYDEKGTVTFKFKMYSKANYVELELQGDDLYTMRFKRVQLRKDGPYIKLVHEYNDLYFDQLKPIFERTTGLTLTVPKIMMKKDS